MVYSLFGLHIKFLRRIPILRKTQTGIPHGNLQGHPLCNGTVMFLKSCSALSRECSTNRDSSHRPGVKHVIYLMKPGLTDVVGSLAITKVSDPTLERLVHRKRGRLKTPDPCIMQGYGNLVRPGFLRARLPALTEDDESGPGEHP